MKKFFGKHLTKYMGDVMPEIEEQVNSIKGTYAPLQQTSFIRSRQSNRCSTADNCRVRSGFGEKKSMMAPPRQSALNGLMGENKQLQRKLQEMKEKLKMQDLMDVNS